MNKRLFIDLEETLIDTWDNCHLGPKNRVLELLDQHFPERKVDFLPIDATVWSFAVWNDKDRNHFNKTMKSWLEGVFDLNFIDVITCEEMLRAVMEFKGFSGGFDFTEMSQMFGKDGSLEMWIRLNEGPGHFILIDDVVPNKIVTLQDTNQIIQTVRV